MIGRFFSICVSAMIASGERRAKQYLIGRYGSDWLNRIQK